MWTCTGRRTKVNDRKGNETRGTRTMKRNTKRQENSKDDETEKAEDKEKMNAKIKGGRQENEEGKEHRRKGMEN
jgi:hypothetical protein